MRRLIFCITLLVCLLLPAGTGWTPHAAVQAFAGLSAQDHAPPADLRAAAAWQAGTALPVIQPVLTATANPDGSVIHQVESGQSLWSIAIAYGVTIAQILEWNGLAQDAVLRVGQTLVIQPSFRPTVSPTPTLTPIPPTRTPSPTATPFTPTLTRTATLTPTETPPPLIEWQPPPWLTQETLGIGLILISAAGLIFVILAAFRSK